MPRTSAALKLASTAATAALLASCSLRLPTQKVPTAKVPGRTNAAASHTKEPHVLVWMIADKWHTGLVFPYGVAAVVAGA